MLERRKSPREPAHRPGSVSFGVAGIVDCTIVNMSTAGACLEFEYRPVLPKGFSVIIKPEYIRRTCRVVWQTQSRVGVTFVGGH
jgi:hypothetical protein